MMPLLLCRAIANGFHPTTHKVIVYNHLGPLSCKKLGPPATLATWVSLLYVRLTDSLEFQDTTLFESLSNYIHYNTTMKSRQGTHWITSNSYHIHVSHTKSTCNIKALYSHANEQPTNQSMIHFIPNSTKS